MIQKIIANIYQRKITKTYNENGSFVCNYILEYRDALDNGHKVSVFSVDYEPIIEKDLTFYLVEIEVYAKKNVQFNNDKLYLTQVRVLNIEPLRSELEIRNAQELIYKHYNHE